MLRRGKKTRWVWYASQSERPVHLDPKRYPSIEFDGKQQPRPDWICQSENGGLHVDARADRIDVHVASYPVSTMELNWTEPYALNVLARSWMESWRDLIDPDRVFLGALFLDGNEIEDWMSIHGVRQPSLRSDQMTVRNCARCGNVSTWTRGREYFDEPDIEDQRVLVNGSGVYLREDIVRERNIRTPSGAFKPSYVLWKAG